MDITDGDYMKFLEIYFKGTSDAISSLNSTSPKGNTPEEIQKSKAKIDEQIKAKLNNSECVDLYNTYLKIPAGLRAHYSGTKVPEGMIDAAKRDEFLTLMEWEKHPDVRRVEDMREKVREKYGIPSGVNIPTDIITSATAMAVFATAIKEGYSQGASLELAYQRQHREGLLEEKAAILTDPNLNETEKKEKLKDWLKNKWLVSKKKTRDTIENDWKGSEGKEAKQPEKYVVHLLAKYNRGKISKEELMPKLADMVQQIDNQGRHDMLLNYLKEKRIQAKIGRFSNETRDILADLVLKKVPEAEREQYLARDWRKKRSLKQDMSDDKKAAAVAKDIKTAQANALPKNSALSQEERRANMPTTLRRDGIQRES